ncbi:hypothetical protein EIP86_003009 [Pleurotus ostreatoroseus]|nr:hypothetical protein EIP86_003009 [Pleurotus ostreatoroseus]
MFKTFYKETREKYERDTGLHLTKEQFLKLIKKPFEQAFRPASIKATIRVTGVELIAVTVIAPEMVAPSAEQSATVAFPLELPKPVTAVRSYFRALQQRAEHHTNPMTPLRTTRLVRTEPTTPVSKISRHSGSDLPNVEDAPTLFSRSHRVLQQPIPTTLRALRLQNTKLREALQEAEEQTESSSRIIETQNITMSLHAIGYEEQVQNLGAKEAKMRSNREKLLVKKTGRYLTGDEPRAAAAQDAAIRDAKKTKQEMGKKRKEVKAALNEPMATGGPIR